MPTKSFKFSKVDWILDGSMPWSGSLATNAYITWIADYTPALIDSSNGGTSGGVRRERSAAIQPMFTST